MLKREEDYVPTEKKARREPDNAYIDVDAEDDDDDDARAGVFSIPWMFCHLPFSITFWRKLCTQIDQIKKSFFRL